MVLIRWYCPLFYPYDKIIEIDSGFASRASREKPVYRNDTLVNTLVYIWSIDIEGKDPVNHCGIEWIVECLKYLSKNTAVDDRVKIV